MSEPIRTLPCELCGKPIPVERADTEWTVHWGCLVRPKKANAKQHGAARDD